MSRRVKSAPRAALALATSFALAAGGCGNGARHVTGPAGGDDNSTATGGDVHPVTGVLDGTVDVMATVDPTKTAQKMVGFGGAISFYGNYLTQHPNKGEIYDLIFHDLSPEILRVGNWYQNTTGEDPTLDVVQQARKALGTNVRILMSSWSPPASLKNNGATTNGGTLIQANGSYAYDQFGAWWAAALAAYAPQGVVPDYVSVQNEPDFQASWESCRFAATESATRAGYGPALDSVYAALQAAAQQGAPMPLFIGPEVAGLNTPFMQTTLNLQSYVAAIDTSKVAAIAHHLYSGGDETNPDSYAATMGQAAAIAAGKPIFMTEFSPPAPDFFGTAWMIHDALTVEGVSAYLYWGLTWAPAAPTDAGTPGVPTGLITTENPFDTNSWTTPKGYVVNPPYYALKHYAKWTGVGWTRVGASTNVDSVRVSAFLSPDAKTMTLVLLNADATNNHTVAIGSGAFSFGTSAVYRTSGTTEQTASLGALGAGHALTLPPRSVATVVLGP